MESILAILGELESLESLVKLARKKHNEGLKTINVTKVESSYVVQKININKSHYNKTLHLLVEISNHMVKGLVKMGTSMFVMSISVVWKLRIMHLVFSSKLYKIISSVDTSFWQNF